MRKHRTLGIVLPALLFFVGAYLLHESTANSQWYMDFFLIAGAAFSVVGLLSTT